MTSTVIAHLTDPHTTSLASLPATALLGKRALGYLSWRRKRRLHHTQAMLQATTDAALSHSPDALVLTGDLMHVGHISEMQQIRDWLCELSQRVPVLLVPGNHDLYHRDSEASWTQSLTDLPLFGEALADSLPWPRQLTINDVRIIGLSSAYPAPFFKADGQLGKRQLAALSAALSAELPSDLSSDLPAETHPAVPSTPAHTLIALHHPADPAASSKRKALKDAQALGQVLSTTSADGLLHGHLHTNMAYDVGGVPCYCTASASSTAAKAPASFRLLHFSSGESMRARLFEAQPATKNTEHPTGYCFEEQPAPH